MNQILSTKNNFTTDKNKNNQISKKIIVYKLEFIFSTFMILFLIILSLSYFISIKNNEIKTNILTSNYNLSKLYSDNLYTTNTDENKLFGTINIPDININYPIFSYLDDDLLKISPCKIYGTSPSINGNLCIAGHNYNNSKFFSKIDTLQDDSKIIIIDTLNEEYIYYVYKIYEVKEDDLSPIFNYDNNSKELTLITCNNFNNNRIIVKAKQKDFYK